MLKKALSVIIAAAMLPVCGYSAGASGDTGVVLAVGSEDQTPRQMTLDDLRELAKKGGELSFSDLAPFIDSDGPMSASSVMPYVYYYIEDGYYLLIGGSSPGKPRVAELSRYGCSESIDIRTGDVEAFIAENAAANEDIYVGGTETLTLDGVRELAKKGSSLTWSDFEPYRGRDVGSGLYILEYVLEDGYTVLVGGVPGEDPWYIYLSRFDSQNRIDIRTDDVEAFIANTVTETMPVSQPITTTTTTAANEDIYVGGTETLTLDGVRKLAKKGSSLTWSDFEPYRGRDIGSGLYILEYVLEDGYTVLVGGVPQDAPIYIYLCYHEHQIDIRTEDVEAFIAEYSEGDSRYTIDENYVLFNEPVDVAWVMSDKNFDDYCKNNTYKFYVPDGSKYIILIGQYNVDVNELLNDPTMPDVDCTIQSYTVERSNGEITVEAGEEYFVPYPHNDEEAEAVFAQDHSIYSKVMELTGKDYFFRTVRARGDDKEINEKSLMISSSAKGRLFVTRETPDGGTVTAEQREEEGSGAGTKIFAVTASDESMYPEDSDPLHIPTSVLKVTRIDQGIVTNYELMESCGYLIQSKMKISSCKLGDVSGDGNFNVADIVLFQRWLLGQKPENFKNWQAADMDGSGELDVFDLAKMKRYLVETI
ncbi:dockerin type I repeat-containing protein [uncultured Ruminococcus sp.]|uniref:dockerin type I repeat-containing protein n=1 Tax=uncultured Ruminococcus sp. TaxID=165186 RepID=UPI00261C6EBD|nr:dockerin type I repeat-containing protein [uncultured Ruminococcus sp.]